MPQSINEPEPTGDPKDEVGSIFDLQEAAGGKMAYYAQGGADAENEAAAWTRAFLTGDPVAGPGDTEVDFEITAGGEEYDPVMSPATEAERSGPAPAPDLGCGVQYRTPEQAMPTPKPIAKTEPQTTELRVPQRRILAILAGAKAPLDRKRIARDAKCDEAGLTEHLGSQNETKRKANDTKHFPSLLTLEMVKSADTDDGTVYTITAKGRKAVAN